MSSRYFFDSVFSFKARFDHQSFEKTPYVEERKSVLDDRSYINPESLDMEPISVNEELTITIAATKKMPATYWINTDQG